MDDSWVSVLWLYYALLDGKNAEDWVENIFFVLIM